MHKSEVDLDMIYKETKNVDNFFTKGEHSFAAILEQLLLINFIIID